MSLFDFLSHKASDIIVWCLVGWGGVDAEAPWVCVCVMETITPCTITTVHKWVVPSHCTSLTSSAVRVSSFPNAPWRLCADQPASKTEKHKGTNGVSNVCVRTTYTRSVATHTNTHMCSYTEIFCPTTHFEYNAAPLKYGQKSFMLYFE